MPKISEIKLIRVALDLSQAEMGRALGGNTQSAYQAWESNPDKPAGQKALEAAKQLYWKKTGKEWASMAVNIAEEPAGPHLTLEAFAEWRGYWKAGMEEVLKRIERLEAQVRKLSPPEERP